METGPSSSSSHALPIRTRHGLESVRPPPVSSARSLIELLTGKLVTDADNVTLSKAEVQDIIQQLGLSVESTVDGSLCRELVQVKKELKTLTAHCRLGDYAGRVFNDLKERWSGPYTPKRADILAQELRVEEAGGGGGKNAKASLVAEAFYNSAANLPWKPWFADRMSASAAKIAVYAYSDRNLVCHSESIQRKTVGDWHGLGQQISEDLQQLQDVLPDDQLEHETDWRRIILYYRDRYIRLNPKGIWQPIPEKEFLDGLPSGLPRPIDVRALPSDLRTYPFGAGNFRDPVLVDSQAWGRRVATRSDPVQDGKRKRDDDLSESLEGKPLAKAPRPDDATKGSTTERATLEEHQKLLFDLHHVLQQIADKNLGKSKALLQSLLSSGRETLAEFEDTEERCATRAAKEARRRAKRTGSSLR